MNLKALHTICSSVRRDAFKQKPNAQSPFRGIACQRLEWAQIWSNNLMHYLERSQYCYAFGVMACQGWVESENWLHWWVDDVVWHMGVSRVCSVSDNCECSLGLVKLDAVGQTLQVLCRAVQMYGTVLCESLHLVHLHAQSICPHCD